MARSDTSTDSQYDSLSRRISSLESRRNTAADEAISQAKKRTDDLASEVAHAQRDLRRLRTEFDEFRAKARRQRETLAAGRRRADGLTAAIEAELDLITGILVNGLPSRRLTFDELLCHRDIESFSPGSLGVPVPAPRWENFAPPPPRWPLSKMGGARRHERDTDKARSDYEAQKALHAEQEAGRLRALGEAQLKHETDAARQQAAGDAWNAEVERARAGFRARDPEAISWLASKALGASEYPDWYPSDQRRYEVTCQPRNGGVRVELELPPIGVIPGARRYEYLEDKSECVALPRPRGEVALLYAGLIAGIALRTASEVLAATAEAADTIQAVTISARAHAMEAATGMDSRPWLLVMSMRREALDELELARVDPLACAAHLGARISPDLLTPIPVEPPAG